MKKDSLSFWAETGRRGHANGGPRTLETKLLLRRAALAIEQQTDRQLVGKVTTTRKTAVSAGERGLGRPSARPKEGQKGNFGGVIVESFPARP